MLKLFFVLLIILILQVFLLWLNFEFNLRQKKLIGICIMVFFGTFLYPFVKEAAVFQWVNEHVLRILAMLFSFIQGAGIQRILVSAEKKQGPKISS